MKPQRVRAQAFLTPLVEASTSIARRMLEGEREGLVLEDRTSRYRDGSRAGWWNVEGRSWQEREAWRFE